MVLQAHDSPSEGTPLAGEAGGAGGEVSNGNPGPVIRRAGAGRVVLRPDLSVTDAAALVISERFEAVARALEDLHESPQGVRETHALRVSTRRATAALTVFGPHLDPQSVKKAKRKLRALRSAAGAVRSCDVQEELLLSAVRGSGGAERDEALVVAAELMLGRVQRWREKARRMLAEAREAYRPGRARRTGGRLIGTIHAARGRVADDRGERLAAPTFRQSAGSATALEAARAGIRSARRRFEEAGRLAERMADFEALHEMRLAGKRLRYVIELMAPALEEEAAESAVATLRKLQDRLGEVNDRHELATRTDEAARELGLRTGGKTARAFAELRQTLVASRDGLLDEFDAWWWGASGSAVGGAGAAPGGAGGGKRAKLGRALDRLLGVTSSNHATATPGPAMGPSAGHGALGRDLHEAIASAESLVRSDGQEVSR